MKTPPKLTRPGLALALVCIVKAGTEGVVTGKYVGAAGTILSEEVKGGSTTTITRLE